MKLDQNVHIEGHWRGSAFIVHVYISYGALTILFFSPRKLLANIVIYVCAITVGVMSYYMADRKHRKAFLEARQSLEVKLNLEEQSQQQVKQYSILCVIVWLVGLWQYICNRDILNSLSTSLYEILIANVWSVSMLSKLNSLQGSAQLQQICCQYVTEMT